MTLIVVTQLWLQKNWSSNFFHLETGNRCFDENVPEEINRRIIDHTSEINLVYTEHARQKFDSRRYPSANNY